MTLALDELDRSTRRSMLRAFEEEQASGAPYVPAGMSRRGRERFPVLVRVAITDGDDDDLGSALQVPAFWSDDGDAPGGDELGVGVSETAYLLGVNEFNTWYVRGLALRLLHEGAGAGEVFLAARRACLAAACGLGDGDVVALAGVMEGHRARYWPPPGDPTAFSVPAGPGCFHSLRRAASGTE